MPHDAFISHSAPDKAIGEAVCATLESKHIRCWIAPRDILAGSEWAEAIVDAIDGSRIFILVLSSSSNKSPQVIREVTRAASKGIPIIPLRIDDVSPSKAMEFFISSHHWFDAQTPPLKKHLHRLAATVQQLLTQEYEAGKRIEMPEEKVKPAVSVERPTEAVKVAARPAVSVERPAEAVKVATRPAWSRVGIALLSIALGLLAWGTVVALLGEHTLGFYVIMLLLAVPFMISGIYCLRRGMAQDLRTMPVEGRIPNWWWLLPVVLAFVGGIISWAKQKDVNWRQAMNILTLGIILTPIWTIPLVMFPALEAPIPVGPIPASQLIYEDDFSDPNSGWPRGSVEEGEGDYEDGEYYILVKRFNWSAWEVNPNAGQFTDFTLEIDARLISGPRTLYESTNYGLIFRVQDNEDAFYEFLVSEDGDYSIMKRLKGVWTKLQSRTNSAFINKGNGTNHLKVVCQGSQIEVYVNGYHLTTVTDSSFASGSVGMIVRTSQLSQPDVGAAFDNIRVYSGRVTPSTPLEAPVANFSAIPTSGWAPVSVTFTDESTGDPASWSWDFPGGSPSSASTQGPHTVTYSAAGNYTVNLTVENARGNDTETKTRYINVIEAPIPAGQLIYEDDFSDPNSGWPRESINDCELNYEDGEYHILVKKFFSGYKDVNRNAGQFTDFTLEIDARLISGRNLTAYGLIFRDQDDDNFYQFLVSPYGQYWINRQLNSVGTVLQSLTKSAFINEGYSTNHLKVVCQGSQIEVYVNEHYLTTVTDNFFTEGYVGMVVNTLDSNGSVAFDNIRVYSLD